MVIKFADFKKYHVVVCPGSISYFKNTVCQVTGMQSLP